ncbi:MAG: ATP-binding protein [Candidatus Bipolaricaulia bacterium]
MPWLVGYPREKVNWHPIIDYGKCTACGVCLSCGNGVFRWKDGRPEVAEPFHCVIGCTTCANLCPEWAISFPEITEVRRIYEENDIWGKISRAMKEEGQI